ncbi:MAG: hypothetical protein JRH10_00225 [Deltaproteobacteria bacterium]|nr:hypothetical protein [Deltaproteobacteria bacterium]
MTMRTTWAVLAMAALCGPAAAEPQLGNTPPPAAPAPTSSGDFSVHLEQLAEARRDVLEAERELRQANAALVRARGSSARIERATARQQEAQSGFDVARSRVPEVLAQARAAGLSASVLRSYEHSLYGN